VRTKDPVGRKHSWEVCVNVDTVTAFQAQLRHTPLGGGLEVTYAIDFKLVVKRIFDFL